MFLTKEGISGPMISAAEEPEPASPDPADHPVNLYRYPALYDALKTPAPPDVAVVRAIMERHAGLAPWSILDPASGPGNWLRPFCDGHNRLVGNDYCEPMVEYVRQTLGPCGCEVLHGDMYKLRIEQKFDVVLEASGVTSIVPDASTLGRVIDHWAQRMSPRGVMILLVNFRDALPATLPALLWNTGPVALAGGGQAELQYELLEDRPDQGTQLIRRTVTTNGAPGMPPFIREEYCLRVWTPQEVQYALANSRCVRLHEVIHPESGQPATMVADRYLVLRPA